MRASNTAIRVGRPYLASPAAPKVGLKCVEFF